MISSVNSNALHQLSQMSKSTNATKNSRVEGSASEEAKETPAQEQAEQRKSGSPTHIDTNI